MICEVKYNPVEDIAAVEPFGFVNLVDAVEKGMIPSTISNTEVDYNGIDNPQTIYGKPRDIFEAYRMADAIKAVGKTVEKTAE